MSPLPLYLRQCARVPRGRLAKYGTLAGLSFLGFGNDSYLPCWGQRYSAAAPPLDSQNLIIWTLHDADFPDSISPALFLHVSTKGFQLSYNCAQHKTSGGAFNQAIRSCPGKSFWQDKGHYKDEQSLNILTRSAICMVSCLPSWALEVFFYFFNNKK